MGGCTLVWADVGMASSEVRTVGVCVGVTSCRNERRFSTDLGAPCMLSRLEEGGGETVRVFFWSLLGPVFLSLVPLSAYGRDWLELDVGTSVGVIGVGGELSHC